MAESENALNLLPDKPCKHCKSIPKLGLKCKNCGSVLHPGCVKYIKNVKLINDNQVICCANSETEQVVASELCTNINATNIVNNSDVSSIEINYLKSLLAHKDLIINNQQDTIESLKAQVGLLNTLLSSTSLNTVAGSLQQTSNYIQSYSDVIKNQNPLKKNAIEMRGNKSNVDNKNSEATVLAQDEEVNRDSLNSISIYRVVQMAEKQTAAFVTATRTTNKTRKEDGTNQTEVCLVNEINHDLEKRLEENSSTKQK
ncbi:hypothetical protein RN001_006694 [Aquatica leii]|uniref:Phorbol-ester/DAG-type domain-containing protein n=1 Tax=Aquatica leii TaxID=1421715 RepID=A0AAN7P8G8_9COLE|nr:hypothetical protein RN001_006694 [Aquatica leii]